MSVTDYCSSFESDKGLNCMSSLAGFMLNFGYDDVDGTVDTSLLGLTWLTIGYDWTMSRCGFNNHINSVCWVHEFGYVVYNTNPVYSGKPARPVFYLASDVDIKGSGTIDSPFTIGIE